MEAMEALARAGPGLLYLYTAELPVRRGYRVGSNPCGSDDGLASLHPSTMASGLQRPFSSTKDGSTRGGNQHRW
jgi:hypothetical protein